MKISGCVIQNRNIKINDDKTFEAYYKGRHFYVSSNHGLGKPKYDHLTRFNITVTGSDGGYIVNTYDDFHTIIDAIRYALCSSMYKGDNHK